jgi:hypothetical protein
VESNWVHSASRPPIGLLYLPRVIMRMENLVEWWFGRGNRSTRRQPAPVPLCPPQTPHAACTRTRAAAVERQWITAWATARPFLYTIKVLYLDTERKCKPAFSSDALSASTSRDGKFSAVECKLNRRFSSKASERGRFSELGKVRRAGVLKLCLTGDRLK